MTNEDSNDSGIADRDWQPLPGVPSKKYPGLVYLYPLEPSHIGLARIEAAIDAVSTQRELAEKLRAAEKRRAKKRSK
jgi:hypothetical protein